MNQTAHTPGGPVLRTTRNRHALRGLVVGVLLATSLAAAAEPDAAPSGDGLQLLVETILTGEAGEAAQAAVKEGIAKEATLTFSAPAVPEVKAAAPAAEKTFLGKFNALRERITHSTSELVMTSMGFLGVPYVWGGNHESTGFDCSGFVKAVYERTVGLVLPRVTKDQAIAGKHVDKHELQPGDLVFFNTMRRAFSHVGIYIGDGKFIHAPRAGEQVRVEDMDKSYWQQRFNGARRVLTGSSVVESTSSVVQSTANAMRAAVPTAATPKKSSKKTRR